MSKNRDRGTGEQEDENWPSLCTYCVPDLASSEPCEPPVDEGHRVRGREVACAEQSLHPVAIPQMPLLLLLHPEFPEGRGGRGAWRAGGRAGVGPRWVCWGQACYGWGSFPVWEPRCGAGGSEGGQQG